MLKRRLYPMINTNNLGCFYQKQTFVLITLFLSVFINHKSTRNEHHLFIKLREAYQQLLIEYLV